MPTTFTRNWSLFPPHTQEVQLDEKWSSVLKKEKNCDPLLDDEVPACGDNWDRVAYDPEHRLVLSVVNGKRSHLHVRAVLDAVKRILQGRVPRLARRPCRFASQNGRACGQAHARNAFRSPETLCSRRNGMLPPTIVTCTPTGE